ncbi:MULTISPECIES: hypothetical protein [unclassified Pseudoalteromonas]|uniref:hypothetical protein n=1 Tax=unclassified Pseudoalteromonas TaxID=194690 RepID=UPI001C729999|nr:MULTISPECIES: hypothetical protein [unclassified Pseudoalteromonas]
MRSVDINHVVDDKLYEELQEALALADFYFDGIVTDWLFQVDSDASAWLNLMRINSLPDMQESNPEFTRNLRKIEELIDNLQKFHCELFDVFKGSMMYLKTSK